MNTAKSIESAINLYPASPGWSLSSIFSHQAARGAPATAIRSFGERRYFPTRCARSFSLSLQ